MGCLVVPMKQLDSSVLVRLLAFLLHEINGQADGGPRFARFAALVTNRPQALSHRQNRLGISPPPVQTAKNRRESHAQLQHAAPFIRHDFRQ